MKPEMTNTITCQRDAVKNEFLFYFSSINGSCRKAFTDWIEKLSVRTFTEINP